MKLKRMSRSLAVVAKILISLSLFSMLIWWVLSVYLFVGGAALLITAWLMDEERFAALFTAPE